MAYAVSLSTPFATSLRFTAMENPSSPTRRHFIATTAALAASAVTLQAQSKPAAAPAPAGPFKLDPLPYAEDALEPNIDAVTMGIHHGKHHKAYVDNLNKALAPHAELQKRSLETLIGDIAFLPEDIRKPVENNGGGHWNHTFFWKLMAKPGPGIGGAPKDGPLAAAIDSAFGSFAKFQEKFADAATKRFGSGWAWLIAKADGKLAVVSTPNQDNPLMQGIVPNSDRGTPLLALDVWEHAYYLKYQNKRAEYITNWWNVVNWPAATALFEKAGKAK
jgi:superoxide dismutase, Fe-Mn family